MRTAQYRKRAHNAVVGLFVIEEASLLQYALQFLRDGTVNKRLCRRSAAYPRQAIALKEQLHEDLLCHGPVAV